MTVGRNTASRCGPISSWSDAKRVYEACPPTAGGHPRRALRRQGTKATGAHWVEYSASTMRYTFWMYATRVAEFSPCGAVYIGTGYYGCRPSTANFMRQMFPLYSHIACETHGIWLRCTDGGVIVGAPRDRAPVGALTPQWRAALAAISPSTRVVAATRRPEFLFSPTTKIVFDRDAAQPRALTPATYPTN